MRILYVVSRYPGLSSTFVLQEIAIMHALGHEIRVCAFLPPSRAEAAIVADSGFWIAPTLIAPKSVRTLLDTLRTRLPDGADPGVSPSLREYLTERLAFGGLGTWVGEVARAFRADYIHAQFANVGASAAWVATRASGIPFGFTAHAHDIFQKRNPWLGLKTRAAVLPVTISEHHRQHLMDRLGAETGGRFEVVRCGVDLAAFAQHPVTPTHEIIAVARLVEKKGLDILIRALARLPEPRPTCRIVGEGPARRALERQIAQFGLGDTVRLLGALPNTRVRDEIARARLFVLPCRIAADGDRDGLPVVLMEALALGKPAISTPVAGIPELIEHEHTGLLTAVDSADELAVAIARLLAEPDLARRLGNAGRARVAARHDVHRNVAALADLIESHVAPRRSSGHHG